MNNNTVHSTRVTAGGRTYFFDVRMTKKNTPYIVISESRKKDDGFERSRLLIFQDQFEEFKKALDDTITKTKEEK